MTDGQKRYNEFLKSDFWIRISNKKKELIGKCEYCGHTDKLECHHKFYRKDWYDTQLDDLQVLCCRCHPCFHSEDFLVRREKYLDYLKNIDIKINKKLIKKENAKKKGRKDLVKRYNSELNRLISIKNSSLIVDERLDHKGD